MQTAELRFLSPKETAAALRIALRAAFPATRFPEEIGR